jgi:serine/threonine protein kinase
MNSQIWTLTGSLDGAPAHIMGVRGPNGEKGVIKRAAPPDGEAALQNEIEVRAKLDHPAFVPVWAMGQDQGGGFIVMPWAADGTLAGCASVRRALVALVVVAEALAALHSHGYVHYDVGPSNILLAGSKTWLADFGLCRPFDPLSDGPIGAHAPAVDIYGLGKTLYTVLSGCFWQADSSITTATAGLPRALRDETGALLGAMLAPLRQRPTSVAPLRAGLCRLAQDPLWTERSFSRQYTRLA